MNSECDSIVKSGSVDQEFNDAEITKVKRKRQDSEPDSPPPSAFTDLKIDKVLREDINAKLITLQGSFMKDRSGLISRESNQGQQHHEENPTAVILLERKPFDVNVLQHSLRCSLSSETLRNDIYSTHDVFSRGTDADIKATMIYPATEKHVAKYSEHEPYIIRETPQLYKSVTLPCLEKSQFSVQWVYNILEKKTESDRIVMEDIDPETGFIIVPDMKWDRKNIDNLYLVALVHKHGIKSLRDLRKDHIPLLRNFQSKSQKAIKELYGVSSDKLRMYFHYQPSYYHLHVHINHIKWDPPGFNALRAHMFDDVIENLEMDSEFYCKKTISYVVRDNDEIFKAYKKVGYFD